MVLRPGAGNDRETGAKLVVNHVNANRLYYMDGRLTTPFADNMTAWLRKGYKDLDGKTVEKERFVPDNVVVEFADDQVHDDSCPQHPEPPDRAIPRPVGPRRLGPALHPGAQRRPTAFRSTRSPNPRAVAMDRDNSNHAPADGPDRRGHQRRRLLQPVRRRHARTRPT